MRRLIGYGEAENAVDDPGVRCARDTLAHDDSAIRGAPAISASIGTPGSTLSRFMPTLELPVAVARRLQGSYLVMDSTVQIRTE